MKTLHTVAYQEEGLFFCTECHDWDNVDAVPVFAGDALDSIPECSKCSYEIWQIAVNGA